MKRKLILGFVCAGVGVLLLSSIVLSAGLNVTTWTDANGDAYKVFDKDGSALGPGKYVQIVVGGVTPPDPAGGTTLLHSGSEYFNGTVGSQNTGVNGVNGKSGEFDFNFNGLIDPTAGPAFVRVWNATSPQAGAYYNNQAVTMKGPGNPPADLAVNLKTSYKAAKPLPPTCSVGGYSLAYVLDRVNPGDLTKAKYLPSFTISSLDTMDPDGKTQYEVVGRKIRIRKQGDLWADSRTFSDQSKVITETSSDSPYYLADGTTVYELQSLSWNYFGGNDATDVAKQNWGPIKSFTIPSSGGSGGGSTTPISVPYSLLKNDKNAGINTVGIPVAPINVIYGTRNVLVTTYQDLINSLTPEVSAISYWNPTTGLMDGATIDANGTQLTKAGNYLGTNPLQSGLALEIAVRNPLTFTLTK